MTPLPSVAPPAPEAGSLDDLYQQWSSDPTPDRLSTVVRSLEPTISYALTSVGSAKDPHMKDKARLIAAKAVSTYDRASGASLPTWTTGQLMRLRRLRQTTQGAAPVPEKIQMDIYHLNKSEKEFIDKRGREPDTGELADFSHFSPKRIAHIRKYMRSTPSEGLLDTMAMSEDSGLNASGSLTQSDYSSEALDYVYDESDHLDRRLLEHQFGHHGQEILPREEIARRVKLHPSQVSRRLARLSMKIRNIVEDLESVSGGSSE